MLNRKDRLKNTCEIAMPAVDPPILPTSSGHTVRFKKDDVSNGYTPITIHELKS